MSETPDSNAPNDTPTPPRRYATRLAAGKKIRAPHNNNMVAFADLSGDESEDTMSLSQEDDSTDQSWIVNDLESDGSYVSSDEEEDEEDDDEDDEEVDDEEDDEEMEEEDEEDDDEDEDDEEDVKMEETSEEEEEEDAMQEDQ